MQVFCGRELVMAGSDEFLVGIDQLFVEDPYEQLLKNMFAPRQVDLRDVPIHPYDLAGDPGTEFRAMTQTRLARFHSLALLLLLLVPVLPLPNPDTGISHHIIRLFKSTCAGFMVDLLFRDCDLYFAGFRRAIMSPEGEQQWGEWFIFSDLIVDGTVPAYLNAVKMGISSSHRGKDVTTPGGDMAMEDIFQTLSHFQDRVHIVELEQNDTQP
ncbi:unnamed protein product [Urochloa humidicola]